MKPTNAEILLAWRSSVEKDFGLDAYYVFDPQARERFALPKWLKQMFITLVVFEFMKGFFPVKEAGEQARLALWKFVNEIRQEQAAGKGLANYLSAAEAALQVKVEVAIQVMLEEFAALAGADAEAAVNHLAGELEAIGMPRERASNRARKVKERFFSSFE